MHSQHHTIQLFHPLCPPAMGSSFLPRTIRVSTFRDPCCSINSKKPIKFRVSAVFVQMPAGEKIPRISQDDVIDRGATNVARAQKTVYKDSWFDVVAINHLSHNVQAVTGVNTRESGYEGLVEVVTSAYRSFEPTMQRILVIAALYQAFPKPILDLIRWVLPQSKLSREYYAAFTTIFFAWLVGPCEVREGENKGKKEKNIVHIRKCRFLEETNCVGMCQNMCKVPSQTFIKETLGMPVNMVPNFEDMSCEMIFGQEPPAIEDDPIFNQPCYKLCNSKKKHAMNCSG